MVNLIQNENMKIYRRPRTWIMIVLLAVIAIAGSLIMWNTEGQQGERTVNWKHQLEEQRQMNLDQLNDPHTQERFKQELIKRNAEIEYRLANDIRPEQYTMWGPIFNLTGLVTIITLFVVIIAGDSLAGEFSSGTIKLLLIRPASRSKILVSKYISAILFGLVLLLVLFISSFFINGLLYRFSGWSQPYLSVDPAGIIQEHSTLIRLWESYFLSSVSTVMYVTLAFMISAVFRSSAMAIGVSIFAMFAGNLVTLLFQRYEWSKYILFANIDLRQHLIGYPFKPEMTMGFSVTVLIGYFIIFNLLAWAVFTKRDVAS